MEQKLGEILDLLTLAQDEANPERAWRLVDEARVGISQLLTTLRNSQKSERSGLQHGLWELKNRVDVIEDYTLCFASDSRERLRSLEKYVEQLNNVVVSRDEYR